MSRKLLGLVFSLQMPSQWLAMNYVQEKANKAAHSPTFFFMAHLWGTRFPCKKLISFLFYFKNCSVFPKTICRYIF